MNINTVHVFMNRTRTLKPNATYLVSSFTIRAEADFVKDGSAAMLHGTINRAQKIWGFTIVSMEVEQNVFFLVITLKEGYGEELPEIMQWIKSVFAKAWNRKHGISVVFWGERYDCVLVEPELVENKTVLEENKTEQQESKPEPHEIKPVREENIVEKNADLIKKYKNIVHNRITKIYNNNMVYRESKEKPEVPVEKAVRRKIV